jgi:YfiH family protein
MSIKLIEPKWPVPNNIKSYCTTRQGGFSVSPFDSFNLALHVGDNQQTVIKNRELLSKQLHQTGAPFWLEQVHSCDAVEVNSRAYLAGYDGLPPKADASFTRIKKTPCIIMTADCLPVLLANRQGTWVAAIHAGWRGLAGGIIQRTIENYSGESNELIAWMGPAISQRYFEVGEEVRRQFVNLDSLNAMAFVDGEAGKFWCDIYQLARNIFVHYKVDSYGGDFCSYKNTDLFYSFRRDGETGRMASLIWMDS